jgi:gamma-glutamyl-gamma-aminobutyrate hydrolase PuuD
MRARTVDKLNQSVEDKKDFHSVFASLLRNKVDFLKEEKLNTATCTRFYTTIFETLVDVLEKSNIKLMNESVNYIAQQYYDGIVLNGSQELDPNIFNQRAKLENIQTKDLGFMAVMLKNTDFVWPLITELKRRN